MREYFLPTRVVGGDKIENAETLLRSKGLYATINYNVEEWKNYLKMDGIGSSTVDEIESALRVRGLSLSVV